MRGEGVYGTRGVILRVKPTMKVWVRVRSPGSFTQSIGRI